MPIKFQPRFTRQVIPKLRKGGIVVPYIATPLKSLPPGVAQIAGTLPPTIPPITFRFHYVDYPFQQDFL